MGESFVLLPVRFGFRALEPVVFPAGHPGNIVRGAFGSIFRKQVCLPACRDPRACDRRSSCPYALIFEPSGIHAGPSGLADRPRGFVIRAHHLGGATFSPGERFWFDLHLFEVRTPVLQHFVESFRQLAWEGLGPTRGRAALETTEAPAGGEPVPVQLDLSPDSTPVSKLLVRFVTPTELKSGGRLVDRPEFEALASRIRDRLSALRALYGAGQLALDFQGFGGRASLIRLARLDIRRVEVTRRSSRTGRRHPIGGFVGEAEYEGDLREFVPYLRAARWTGVGRQTVWGNGVIELAEP